MKSFVEVSDKLNFLVIDASDAVRSTLKQVLKTLGLKQVIAVPDAPMAFEAIKNQKIDFIFCDRDLRDVTGMDFLKDLRENITIERVPFIMMGYEVTQEDVVLASEYGIDAYLKKPFVMKDISAKLTACIDKFNHEDSLESLFEKARKFFVNKNIKEAIATYEQIHPQLPDSARVRVGLARCLKMQGNANGAIDLLSAAIARNQFYLHAYHELGLIYVGMGRFNEALQNFKKAIEISPKNPIRYELAVDIFLKWDLYPEAEEMLLKAERLELYYPNLNQQLGFVLNKQKKFDKALGYFQKAMKKNPEDVNFMESAGNCLLELERYDEAIGIYNQALKKLPENLKILYSKMVCQIELRQLDKALKTCHLILKIDPKHPKASRMIDPLVKGEKPPL